jgi:hypothetical protein
MTSVFIRLSDECPLKAFPPLHVQKNRRASHIDLRGGRLGQGASHRCGGLDFRPRGDHFSRRLVRELLHVLHEPRGQFFILAAVLVLAGPGLSSSTTEWLTVGYRIYRNRNRDCGRPFPEN